RCWSPSWQWRRFVFVEQFVFGNLVLPVVLLTQLVLVGRFVFVIRVAGAARGGEEVRFVFGNLVLSVVLLTPLVGLEQFVFVEQFGFVEQFVFLEEFVIGARAFRVADAARVSGEVR
ncbi:hypothetical protein PF001_g33530, partial [Phytophthora fragariae]